MAKYEICADESWVHGEDPPNRYWCFFGGLFGTEPDLDRLESRLRNTLLEHDHRREVKWKNTSDSTEPVYLRLVDNLFTSLRDGEVTYRQLFLDRRYVYVDLSGEPDSKEIDVQFKIYYQFLKHSFGLKYLKRSSQDPYEISLRLDRHSSQKHKAALKAFVEDLPRYLNRPDMDLKVSYHSGAHLVRLQICDLLMGAAGSYGNRKHLVRKDGRRGMSDRQKCRMRVAKYIYDRLRELDSETRGSKAFSWFESTGTGGVAENALKHPVRIWKFVPSSYRLDNGWVNKNLTKEGQYVAEALSDQIHSPGRAEVSAEGE